MPCEHVWPDELALGLAETLSAPPSLRTPKRWVEQRGGGPFFGGNGAHELQGLRSEWRG